MKRTFLICGVVGAGALLIAGVAYRLSPFSKRTKSLRVVIVAERVADGVTGYRAAVQNVGYLPVVVGRCERVSDAMERTTTIGDAIQQWQPQESNWKTSLVRNDCRITAMGSIEAQFTSKFLWPRQQLHTSPFFANVGVLPGFHHGDIVRFVVYTEGASVRSEGGLPSPQFVVE